MQLMPIGKAARQQVAAGSERKQRVIAARRKSRSAAVATRGCSKCSGKVQPRQL